jgi:hypothetical protein
MRAIAAGTYDVGHGGLTERVIFEDLSRSQASFHLLPSFRLRLACLELAHIRGTSYE